MSKTVIDNARITLVRIHYKSLDDVFILTTKYSKIENFDTAASAGKVFDWELGFISTKSRRSIVSQIKDESTKKGWKLTTSENSKVLDVYASI